MTVEELMNPRKVLIYPYPDCGVKHNAVLHYYKGPKTGVELWMTIPDDMTQSDTVRNIDVMSFPHLWKDLKWYERREPDDLPEYIISFKKADMICGPGKIFKVYRYGIGTRVICEKEDGKLIATDLSYFLPSTEADYQSYIASTK